MKKLLLIITAAMMQLNYSAQTLPNGTFESWSTVAYDEPNSWNTANLRDVPRIGMPSVTKVPGFAGFAIRIENKVVGLDTSESYILNTNNPCSDPPQWMGGVPYSQQPTAISGKYRYNLLGNDTAILIVIFRKNGLHIGDNYIKIRGTGSQTTFASFNFTVNCAGVPDSIIIAAAACDKKSTNLYTNGSYIELDNLAFVGTSQPIPNGDFENWTSKSYDIPTGWAIWGSGVSRTTSSFAGTYAIRLETMNEFCGGVNSSGITNGYNSSSGGPKGGKPYTNTIDTLRGYYKYTSMGTDTANIYINLSKNGSSVGGTLQKLTASASYVYFQIPFTVGTTPDTMRIDIMSSKWPTLPGNAGSVLYVDNLSLRSQATGIFEDRLNEKSVHAFPNPATDVLYIKNQSDIVELNIRDAVGRTIKTMNASGYDLLQINVADLYPGMYYYEMKTKNGILKTNKFIKE